MYIYVASTNDLMGSATHTARMLYLGPDIDKAEESIGRFINYPTKNNALPNQPLLYSALPYDTEREMIQFYICADIWYSIERIAYPVKGE